MAGFVFSYSFMYLFDMLVADSDRVTLPSILAGAAGGWLGYGATVYLATRRLTGGVVTQIGLRFKWGSDIAKGTAAGIAGHLVINAVYSGVERFFPQLLDGSGDPIHDLTDGIHGWWRWLAFWVIVAVVSPLNEEMFFRGFCLRMFASKWGTWTGILLSAVLFASVHLELAQLPALTLFGILLGWRVARTGRVGETVVAHVVFNTLTVLSLIQQ